MKSLILTGPEVRAFLNTKPNTWPAEPIDPGKPWKWQHRVPVRPQPIQDDSFLGSWVIKTKKYSIALRGPPTYPRV